VDILLNVDYSGELKLALEALVSFDRTVELIRKVLRLHGQGRLRFTRSPYTHWSFSFIKVINSDQSEISKVAGNNKSVEIKR
jgi:hypothetical protein